MKISISHATVTHTYKLPDSYNLMFGDAEGMSESRFYTVGRITNVGAADPTLQTIRSDFDGLNQLSATLYSNDVPVYSQNFDRLVYTFSSAGGEIDFTESLHFAS